MKSVPVTQTATCGKYFYLLFVCTACLLIFPGVVHAQQPPKYNVLFIVSDDMNTRLSFMGYPEVMTPNLQRLVNRGMVFNKAYCQFPLCSPSRTSMLTGCRPNKTKVFNNKVRPSSVLSPDVKFLPDYFKQNGYHIERYGKIMHGYFENDISWDYAEPPELNSGIPAFSDEHEDDTEHTNSDAAGKWWVTNTSDSLIQDNIIAVDLVKRLKQPQIHPFFYGLGFTSAHNPFSPNLNYWNKNGDESVQERLPKNASGNTDSILRGNGSANIYIPNEPSDDLNDVPPAAIDQQKLIKKPRYEWKRTIHAYDAEAAQLDAQLGLVLDELDLQNLWESTIVIFIGDHGQQLGEHDGLWGKMTLFEESLGVPFIICVPGKKPGICSRIVELVDIYPTLSELCALPPVNGLEGSSFVRLLDDPEQQWKKAAFSQIKRADTIIGLNVSTNRYRYNSWGTMGEELYDHLNDPKQYINLVSNLAYTTVLNDMRKLLADGWTKTTPPPCTSFKLYADKDADGYGSLSDSLRSCYKPWNYVENYNDCDDTNADVHPTAAEICNNGIDDNCNGLVDENAPVARITALGDTNICVTGAVTLKATQRDGYAFQWRKGNNNIPNERKRYFTATSPGIYRVAVRDSAGCIALSNSIKVVDANCISAGIKNSVDELNLSNDRQTVFPNPSKGNVSVNYYSIHNGSVQLQVFDAGGKLVLSKKVAAVSGTNIFSLTLGHLANGTYFLDIGSPESHFRSLVIIDK